MCSTMPARYSGSISAKTGLSLQFLYGTDSVAERATNYQFQQTEHAWLCMISNLKMERLLSRPLRHLKSWSLNCQNDFIQSLPIPDLYLYIHSRDWSLDDMANKDNPVRAHLCRYYPSIRPYHFHAPYLNNVFHDRCRTYQVYSRIKAQCVRRHRPKAGLFMYPYPRCTGALEYWPKSSTYTSDEPLTSVLGAETERYPFKPVKVKR